MVQSDSKKRCPDLTPISSEIWRFTNQTFYGESVGCYLIRDSEQVLIIETPHFSAKTALQVASFGLPTRIFLTHGATSVDGDQWQREAGIPLNLNIRDFDDVWLRASPQQSFDGDFQITAHLKALHLPAHSKGHTVYYDDRSGGTLFTGDAILFQRGKFRLDLLEAVEDKILNLTFERMLPFHYDSILTDASAQVHEAIKRHRR
jgi:glyoxylase-like metal-dependent hydrolase (beta-lactamase superfamily II)